MILIFGEDRLKYNKLITKLLTVSILLIFGYIYSQINLKTDIFSKSHNEFRKFTIYLPYNYNSHLSYQSKATKDEINEINKRRLAIGIGT